MAAAMPAPPVQIIRPERHIDDRGWFTETYNSQRLAEAGVDTIFVQDNHSMSRPAFTLRGLHFQLPPNAQAKLVRCVQGRIFDVAVDIRVGSPTYGNWVGATLTANGGEQLLVPAGFAHGFLTMEPDCQVIYKCSDFYARESDAGLLWNDPQIAVDWPLPLHQEVSLSEKDRKQPLLTEFESPFPYDGRPLLPLK
jgi:dTDP-4-dehydrorhamnose 3,5-epimerase